MSQSIILTQSVSEMNMHPDQFEWHGYWTYKRDRNGDATHVVMEKALAEAKAALARSGFTHLFKSQVVYTGDWYGGATISGDAATLIRR